MAKIKGVDLDNDNIINYFESDIEIHEKGEFLSGYLKSSKIGRYFYRSNQRYTEVMAGHFGSEFAIGMDWHILKDIEELDAEYIFIETQYNVWQISLSTFLNDMKQHQGVKGVYVCPESSFIKHKKKDELEDDDVSDVPSGKREESNKVKYPRSYKNDEEIRKKADEVNKKAKENSAKARKEDPIGNRETDNPELDDDKEYKDGEQIGLF